MKMYVLSLLLLLTAVIAKSEALKCYTCDSDSSKKDCNDPFDKGVSSKLLKNCTDPNPMCVKFKADPIKIGATTIDVMLRECGSDIPGVDECEVIKQMVESSLSNIVSIKNIQCETCKTDGCNGAAIIGSTSIIVSLFLSAYITVFTHI